MRDQLMVAIFVALGATLVAGLIAIPVLEQQQAAQADKGGVPNTHASSKARGHCVGIECCFGCGPGLIFLLAKVS